jgi:hypothetical protein
MRPPTRQQQIQLCLEAGLSSRTLPSNPVLVSQILLNCCLPIEAVCSIPGLIKLKAAESEVIQSFPNPKCASVASYSGRVVLSLPYIVIPWNLYIQNFTAPITELHRFIAMIHGNTNFQISPIDRAVLVSFEQKGDCCAVWRVLRIVPFRGQTLVAAVHWIPQPQQQQPAPRIRVERPSKEQAVLGRKSDPPDP